MPQINFQLVTPEKTVLSEGLDSLTCPTSMGQITILPGHEPLVANLEPGELVAKGEKGESFIYVAGGFVQVKGGDEVIILADSAEHHHEIDVARAEEAKQRAEQAMREQKMSGAEYAKTAAVIEQNLARINIARKHAHKRSAKVGDESFSDQ